MTPTPTEAAAAAARRAADLADELGAAIAEAGVLLHALGDDVAAPIVDDVAAAETAAEALPGPLALWVAQLDSLAVAELRTGTPPGPLTP